MDPAEPTSTIRAAIAKNVTDVGEPKGTVRTTMPRRILGTCAEKEDPAAMAHHVWATKNARVDELSARRGAKGRLQVMARAANALLTRTVHRTHPVPVPISRIRPGRRRENQRRKKARTSPTPPFDSLLLAPGPASLGPSQLGTGLLLKTAVAACS